MGASAGVFGLAALCLVDSAADVAAVVKKRLQKQNTTSEVRELRRYLSYRATRLSEWEGKILVLCSRTLAVVVVLAFDAYSFFAGERGRPEVEVITVHAAGFLSGLVVSVAINVCRAVKDAVVSQEEDNCLPRRTTSSEEMKLNELI